jgi:hypothetical protein
VQTPAFLVRLLATRGFAGRLGPEDREALAFAMTLRKAALESRLRCIFVHPPMELLRANAQCALAAALGALEGTSDYLFLARDGSMAIEFKSKVGRQTAAQRDFQAWCQLVGVPYHVARSEAQALSLLRDRGWLC